MAEKETPVFQAGGAKGLRDNRATAASPVRDDSSTPGAGGPPGSRVKWTLDVSRVDRERILRGLSQRQLAALARVDPGTLSDMLRCRRRPTLGSLSALCKALGLALQDAITFDG